MVGKPVLTIGEDAPVTQTATPRADTSSRKAGGRGDDDSPGTALVTQHGRTSIADSVVSKIAAVATRDVSGVYDLGGGAARAVGAVRERIPGSRTNESQGVSVEVGERQAAADISLVADYGVAIADLAAAVRRNVIASVERMTGLEVTEVNISVTDVHLPGDGDRDDENADADSSRVQ